MKMKKLLTLCLALMMVFALTACGGKYADSQYTGHWEAASYEAMGVQLDKSQVGEASMDLEANGKLSANFLGQEGTGEWSETDSGIHISSDIELDCPFDGGTLKMEYQGVTINFQKTDAADAEAENGEETPEDTENGGEEE